MRVPTLAGLFLVRDHLRDSGERMGIFATAAFRWKSFTFTVTSSNKNISAPELKIGRLNASRYV